MGPLSCILGCNLLFNKLQAAGLFLALDGTKTCTEPSTSGRKYHKSVNSAVFICNESIFVVSAAATDTFQLEHMRWLLCNIRLVGNEIRSIEYGKL